jgi:lysozyme family protein
MSADLFPGCFAAVVAAEGGYSCEREDSGNWTGGACGRGVLRGTKFGISAATYPGLDVQALTLDQAAEIYRRDFWLAVRGDELPGPLALLVFDAAVNNGVGRAARWLQAAAGVTVDGVLGPVTMAAVASSVAHRGGAALCIEFMAQRLLFMASLPTWRVFGLGWARRLCALPWRAIALQQEST